ncbi:MAG: rhodanese-like domain-containing protein [Flavobacteriales bacterium]|jgi:phage shock protein E|nr:rhodanese-like domain-containing protein [Flavobacteriales bacterium]
MKYFKLLIISVFFLSVSAVSFAQSDSAVKNIEPEVLNTVLNNATVQLVDVRTPNEFKSGHIDKALNINYYDQDFSVQIGKLDKSKAIYVYCRSGVRSKYASDILKKLGFKEIYNLNGGILSWNTQNLPLKK